ncbi:MAG: helix-turn-helix transcriptional regulator [Bdellovibrio sp.]|nr:helix-turn-helix transcriptional regulator [Bdellovibrio sp.]
MKAFNTREISHRTCHIIRDERLSRDLTQIEMASELGISQSALSKIENLAMTPTLIPWLKFCSAFGLPANLPMDEKLYKGWIKELEKKSTKGSSRSTRLN